MYKQPMTIPIHIAVLDGKTYKTIWTDTAEQADEKVKQLKLQGAYFTKIFENDGVLGKFKVIGIFTLEQP